MQSHNSKKGNHSLLVHQQSQTAAGIAAANKKLNRKPLAGLRPKHSRFLFSLGVICHAGHGSKSTFLSAGVA